MTTHDLDEIFQEIDNEIKQEVARQRRKTLTLVVNNGPLKGRKRPLTKLQQKQQRVLRAWKSEGHCK